MIYSQTLQTAGWQHCLPAENSYYFVNEVRYLHGTNPDKPLPMMGLVRGQ